MATRKAEFHAKLERLNDEDLPGDERDQLLAEMLSAPESQQAFLEHQMLAAALEEKFAMESAADDPRDRHRPALSPMPRQSRSMSFLAPLWMCSAAVILLMTGFAFSRFITPAPAPERLVAQSPEPIPDFVLTRAIDVAWSSPPDSRPGIGEAIKQLDLEIESGIIEISFSSGATVTLEGPARLKLDSEMKCRLVHGKLAANCPPSAYGFVVEFPKGNVLDLGTEFGINTSSDGKTDVHVLDGEVIVSCTDSDHRVLSEQNLLGNSAVAVGDQIKEIAYDEKPFAGLKRDRLVHSQPIKLQFDLGHRAGLYAGTNAPAHAAGDMFPHEKHWTQVVGDQSGTFVMADGNVCPYPIKVDYGHGDGAIDWDAQPIDPWGNVNPRAKGVFDTPLTQDHRPWDFDLGLRVSGLPAGTYRIYALCRSGRRTGASYDVSFGVNLNRQVADPLVIPPMDPKSEPSWIAGVTYAVDDVEVSGSDDWATFITRYSRERSSRNGRHGRSVLLGLQIVQIRPTK